jgi:ribulose-phosphate 3-epimerase
LALPLIPDLSAIKLGPSLLSADFLRLGAQLQEMETAHADFVHFDVMDGQFVPNISIGLPVLEAARAGTSLPIDVHLMMVQPDRWVESFVEAGADVVTFHIEATPHAHRVAQSIERAGGRPGVALNPSTPLDTIAELLPFVRQVLIMTVNPGFGGQAFIPEMVRKVERLADLIDRHHLDCLIQVDGGSTKTPSPRLLLPVPDRSWREVRSSMRSIPSLETSMRCDWPSLAGRRSVVFVRLVEKGSECSQGY